MRNETDQLLNALVDADEYGQRHGGCWIVALSQLFPNGIQNHSNQLDDGQNE